MTDPRTVPRGFTLIELLVVIAIIGLLSSVVLASLNTAREKGKMAKRESDFSQLKTALELYYDDNGHYPVASYTSQCAAWGSLPASNVIPGLVPTYLPAMPADPDMNAAGNTGCYIYISNGTDYKVLDYRIPTALTGVPSSLIDPLRNIGTAWSYAPCSGATEGTWTMFISTDTTTGRCAW
jgi:type II secretion system protein G